VIVSKFVNSMSKTADGNSAALMLQICQSSDFDCNIKAVDLVFVVSASSSVGWSNVVSFVSSIASVLNVQDGLARVGLVTSVSSTCTFYSVLAFNTVAQLTQRDCTIHPQLLFSKSPQLCRLCSMDVQFHLSADELAFFLYLLGLTGNVRTSSSPPWSTSYWR